MVHKFFQQNISKINLIEKVNSQENFKTYLDHLCPFYMSNSEFSQEVIEIDQSHEDSEDSEDDIIHKKLRRYESVDFFRTYGDTKTAKQKEREIISQTPSKMSKIILWISKFFNSTPFLTILFLTLLGFLNAVVSFFLDYLISHILTGREKFSQLSDSYFTQYVLWIAYSLFFAIFAAIIPEIVSPFSVGSGIPEMKSILSGIKMERYLGLRTLVSKFLGLLASFGGGFQIGKEGPFVHISCCIANFLLKFPCFERMRRNEYYKNQFIAVAAAAGVSATFGSPFGGVIFSIEVCATYFPVECLWKGTFCSLIGSSIFYLFRTLGLMNNVEVNLFETNFHDRIDIDEYIPLMLMAIVFGLLGSLFIELVKALVILRQKDKVLSKYRLILVLCFSFIMATLTFPLDPFLKRSNFSVGNVLFSENDMENELNKSNSNILLMLIISVIAKFVLTAVSIALPISCGLFTPVFIIGGAIGRLYGELNKFIIYNDKNIIPGGYAVVGASTFAASITRTLSTAVILFELTGQMQYLIPVIVCGVIAYFVGNLINLSIYDSLLTLKGLPIFSILKNKKVSVTKRAKDIMKRQLDYITEDCSIRQLKYIIRKADHIDFPLLDEHKIMLGEIQRENIIEYLKYVKKELEIQKIKNKKKNQIIIQEKNNNIYNPRFMCDKDFIKGNEIYYDSSFISLSQETSLSKLYYLFSHVGLSKCYITNRSKLVGVITKKMLINLQT